MRTRSSVSSLLLATLLWGGSAFAQDNPHPASAASDAQPQDADQSPAPSRPAQETPADTMKRSWQTLTDTVQNSKHFESQIQALNALSDLGSNAHADGLIAAAMKDPNFDVRTAAVIAAGKTKSRVLIEPIKKLLDDHEPQVVFAAATTLWKQFKDKSGEDILAAIAAGDRKANPTLIHGAEHDMSRTLHSPSTLEKIGIETGAGMLLGPFGFSIGAVEYARKNGSDAARVQAIDLLSEEKTQGVHDQMKSALDDKDPGVRAAAVKVLGSFHRAPDAKVIAPLIDDAKLPIRLAASAAYIDCLSGTGKATPAHR